MSGSEPAAATGAKDPASAANAALASGFRAHERHLRSLLLRMTGCAADAEDLVQETFVRALEHAPEQLDAPLRPWLVRVAMNLGRDFLRRRRRIGYVGPWLPSPVPTDPEIASYEIADPSGLTTEGRYDLVESVSFAFLLALEALTPAQRAVLLLRDVFDYSARETADALDMSEAAVRTTHHRARKAMSAYERKRRPLAERRERTREALFRFVGALAAGDVVAVEAQLAADCIDMSDGGGEYLAARNPIYGSNRVARYMLGIRPEPHVDTRSEMRELGGLPALVLEFAWETTRPRAAPRVVIACDVDDEGRITAFYTVLASRKLTEVAAIGGGV